MKLLMHEDNNNRVTLYDNIDSETLEEASLAADRIHTLLEDMAFGDSIKESLDELKESCKPTRIAQDVQHRRIERKTKAFLSEFHILLNHWEKKAKRQDGNHADIFTELTHQAYDAYDEYGFTYNLRNYATHVGDVVSLIHTKIGYKSILPMANRDFLLRNYKKWKSSERAFICKQSEYFDLLPIFEKSFQAVQAIHLEMMDYQLTPQTIQDCQKLITLRDDILKLNTEPGFWDIIEFFNAKDHPICLEDIPKSSFRSCVRSYVNWDVYPLIQSRAKLILAKHKSQNSVGTISDNASIVLG